MTTYSQQKVVYQDLVYQRQAVDTKTYLAPFPFDEDEEGRLEVQNSVMYEVFGKRWFLPPMNNPRVILDCGHGAGHWAQEMADAFPDSIITAIDVWWELLDDDRDGRVQCYPCDLNGSCQGLPKLRSFTRGVNGGTYDFIHSRFVGLGIEKDRWQSYVNELRNLVQPGGWIQLVEYEWAFRSDSGMHAHHANLTSWDGWMRWWLENIGKRDSRVSEKLDTLLRNAGLQYVQPNEWKVPIGSWSSGESCLELNHSLNPQYVRAVYLERCHESENFMPYCVLFSHLDSASLVTLLALTLAKDGTQQRIGSENLTNMKQMLWSVGLKPFTDPIPGGLAWSVQRYREVVTHAQAELENMNLRLYIVV